MGIKGLGYQRVENFHQEIYGFDPEKEKSPFFPALLEEAPEVPQKVHKNKVENIPWVHSALSFVKPICQKFGFEVLLVDLTIIQDARLGGLNTKNSYLANYVLSYKELRAKAEIRDAYRRTLKFMGADGPAKKDPLVPHPRFYNYAYLFLPVDSPTDGSGDFTSEYAPWQSAFRQRYPYSRGTGKRGVRTQLKHLRNHFLEEMKGADAENLFGGSILLAVPFHRRPFQPLMSGKDSPSETKKGSPWVQPHAEEASPGGGLFLFLKPSQKWDDKREDELRDAIKNCAYTFRRFLTDLTLTESSNQTSVQLAFQSLTYFANHASISAIRSIRSSNLKAVSESLQEILNPHPELLKDLNQAAHIIECGENTASTMLSLIGMAIARAGQVPEKCRNLKEASVRTLIDEAGALVNTKAELAQDDMKPLKLSFKPHDDWVIPKDYLSSHIVRGFLLEMLENSSLHGEGDGEGCVQVSITLSNNDSDLTVSIESSVSKEGEWAEKNGIMFREQRQSRNRPRYLDLFNEFCAGLKGIEVSSHVDSPQSKGSVYCARLRLGKMSITQGNQSVDVEPILRNEERREVP